MGWRYVVAATLAALLPATPSVAESQAREAKAQRALDFRVHVPAVLRMTLLERKPVLQVAAAAAGGAVVAVEEAVRLRIVCNLRGYALHFAVHDPQVVAVEVEGLGSPLTVGPGGAAIHVPVTGPGERRATRTLSYRVHYAPGVPSGPRPVPVSISLAGA